MERLEPATVLGGGNFWEAENKFGVGAGAPWSSVASCLFWSDLKN